MLILLVWGHFENLCSKPFPTVLDFLFLKYFPSAQPHLKMTILAQTKNAFLIKKDFCSWSAKLKGKKYCFTESYGLLEET